MGISTVRPNSHSDVGVPAVGGGAGSSHAAVNDDSDSTYVYNPGGPSTFGIGLVFGYPAPTIPGGAILTEARQRLRSLAFGTYRNCSILGTAVADRYFSSLSPSTWELGRVAVTAVPGTIQTHLEFDDALPSTDLQTIEVYLDFVYVEQPDLTVDSPSGTVDTTNLPTIEWTPDLDSDGGLQTSYEVKVFDDATYGGGGFDPDSSTPDAQSGELSGTAASWRVGDRADESLANDTYKAYVRVAQTVAGAAFWSDWAAGSAFTIDVPLPGEPAIAASSDDDNARIRLDLAPDNTGEETFTGDIQLQRSTDGGDSWENARTLLGDGLVEMQDPTLRDFILGLNPTLYWPCDAGHGVTDQSGNSRNGTAQGGATIGGGPSLSGDTADSSTDLDGSNDFVSSSYAAFAAGSSRTFMGIARRDTSSGQDTLFGGTTGSTGPGLYIESSGQVTWVATGAHTVSWPAAWPGNGIDVAWAFTYNATSGVGELFIDGVSQGQHTVAIPAYSTPGNFAIGAYSTPTAFYDGKLSHIVVAGSILTDAQIADYATLAAAAPEDTIDLSGPEAYDYEASNGASVTYRARARHLYADGGVSVSDWVESSPASWSSEDVWLKHPTDPSLNAVVVLRNFAPSGIVKQSRQGKFQPLGSTDQVVVADTRAPDNGQVGFACDTDEERAALVALLATLAPLLLQFPPTDHEPDRWLAFGDHTSDRIVDRSWGEARTETLDWDEVPTPAGDLIAL